MNFSEDPDGTGRRLPTTQWSVVIAAARESAPESRQALQTLCQTYWYPLYAYVRQRGYQPADAQDLVQAFFAHVLEKGVLAAADPRRGRFRTFLLTVLQRFIGAQRQRAAARKRGGAVRVLSLDFQYAEQRYCHEPFHELTPEHVFQRRWALTVLDDVLARLEQECAAKGKTPLFDGLKTFLTGTAHTTYDEASAALGMSPGAIKVAVHRLRRRYRELLRQQVADTVAGPDQVDDELDCLLSALRAGQQRAPRPG